MIALPVAATLALAIAMPALACDEEYKTIASPNPVVALVPRPPHAPSPGAFAPFVAASLSADGTTNSTITIVDNDDGNPIINASYYRHWPAHHYVTTAASSYMRR